MLVRVQVKHELSERALEPRQLAFENHEACACKLGGGLEIHLLESFPEFEVLFRRKRVAGLCPESMPLDVIDRTRAVRHIVQWQVGNLRKRALQLTRDFLFLFL